MEITVSGTICANDEKEIYDWIGWEATCPKDVLKALDEAGGKDVTLLVNSQGGDVFAGNEIYSALQRYKGKTTAEITGFAASAATIICCGADYVKANAGIQYMIHNVSTGQSGDHKDMETMAEVLRTADESIANIYVLKTGLDRKEILNMMGAGSGNMGTWMDAKKAKDLGFVDEIIGDNGSLAQPISYYNHFGAVLSDEVKAKIRRELEGNRQKAKARLNLLRLKGGRR